MKTTLLGLLASAALAANAAQNTPELTPSILASGGGSASGGACVITHTLGEPIAGIASGGDYSICAGFMTQEFSVDDVDLKVTFGSTSLTLTENIAHPISLSVTNAGSVIASNVELTVALPAGFRVTAASASAGACRFTASTATCSLATLAGNATFTVNLTVRANFLPLNSELTVNLGDLTAAVSSAETDLDTANNTLAIPVTVVPQTDWGDARGGFPVTAEENGPYHRYSPTAPWLGARWDNDGLGNHSPLADFDDTHGATDDDDGVLFASPIVAGLPAVATVTCANSPGFLDAWADFNNDGDWDDAGERIATRTPLAPGSNTIPFTVPASAVAGSITTRWRVSTTGGLSYTGYGGVGEVEDHLMVVRAAPRLSLRIAPGVAALSFQSENQVNYVIEYIDSIPGESWALLGRVSGDGGNIVVTDNPSAPMRFYRVRIE